MTYFLQMFGELRLLDQQGRDVPFPEKGLLILCFMALSKVNEQPRTLIARLLWSGDEAMALVNLRKTISRVKKRQEELGANFLNATPTSIEFDRSQLLNEDAAVVSNYTGDKISRLKKLTSLTEAGFLERLDHENDNFEKWREQRRQEYLVVLAASIRDAARTAETQEESTIVKEAALSYLKRRPNEAIIQQILLKAYEAEGQIEDVRRIFEKPESFMGKVGSPEASHLLDTARQIFEERNAPVIERVSEQRKPNTVSGEIDRLLGNVIPRLALLPPITVDDTATSAIFAGLLMEDITIGLCTLRNIRVIAPYTAKKIENDADKAGVFKRHSISYVVESRLTNESGRLSLFVQLIHFATDDVIWAERFAFDHSDLIKQRREISRRIAMTLAHHIERNELVRTYFEESPEAYRHYLLGQRHLGQLTLPDLRRARKELRAALQASPNFSPALSGLARTYSKEWLLTARGDIELLKMAKRHSEQAIAVGQDLSGGHRELGVAKMLMGDIDESLVSLELAESLSPHYADIIADHADTLVHSAQPAAALEKIENAINLNPIAPDAYLWTAAGASYFLGHYEPALGYINRMAESGLADRLSAASWAMLGDIKKARVFVRKVKKTHPDFDLEKWLSVVPVKEQWQIDHYREGLRKAGF